MSETIAHDTFHRITDTYGYIVVAVETTEGEHHQTNRAAARAFLAQHMPSDYVLHQYIGEEHYRRADGYPATARRYSVVFTGPR